VSTVTRLLAKVDDLTAQAVALAREVDALSDGHQVSQLDAAESLLFAWNHDLRVVIGNLPTE
jgi:hypothetical protein